MCHVDRGRDPSNSGMRTLYLMLTIVGFAIPAVFVPIYALEHPDNLLFITNPTKTLDLMFGDAGRSGFSADLLWVFIVFFVWLTVEARARGIRHSWIYIVLTCLFGMSGPFPLFLYVREKTSRRDHDQMSSA
jgi:hypothetical protein